MKIIHAMCFVVKNHKFLLRIYAFYQSKNALIVWIVPSQWETIVQTLEKDRTRVCRQEMV